MKEFIENYIIPLKEYYLSLGALILLFTLLEIAFKDFIANSFLLGMILFIILIVFIYLLKETLVIDYKQKSASLISITYVFFLSFFIMLFFISVFGKYKLSFLISLGIFLGFLEVILLGKIRGYFVIFQKNIKRVWIKKSLRVIFTLIIFIGFILIISHLGIKINLMNYNPQEIGEILNLSPEWWFILIIIFFNMLMLLISSIINLIDIFRKEPMNANKLVWEKSQIYMIKEKIKTFISSKYS